jgi:GMP synthase-like glutamine amidotransferase
MRIRCFQHVAFENAGGIANWAASRGHELAVTRLFAGDELPSPDSWDWLIVLGGPMSVHDEATYSWLRAEKQYVAEAIRRGTTIIGICLGAQLIAEALGAKVYANAQKEIGWFKLQWLHDERQERSLFQAFPAETTVFHWHGETFDLPAGAKRLASSEACVNQAFVYANTVLGLQFHLEMREENVRLIVDNCGEELVAGPYIQTADELLNRHKERDQALILLEALLDGLAARG